MHSCTSFQQPTISSGLALEKCTTHQAYAIRYRANGITHFGTLHFNSVVGGIVFHPLTQEATETSVIEKMRLFDMLHNRPPCQHSVVYLGRFSSAEIELASKYTLKRMAGGLGSVPSGTCSHWCQTYTGILSWVLIELWTGRSLLGESFDGRLYRSN
ncbi:hypothetical protein DL89DRAFT_149192 [Linderina pennispora]|uniref:Uncharacterized protein n=1 Tax=Linderina pennispora TaxID=61395 RepID=A0A1Y1W8S6_9FUNG|nr:uncharacterized protein DL89DRAFT_149192 [Linderina pennispora]ORX69941.1 hypothetical protein DL89DRAFT_149192 [Linderina pennispora]